jgi:serine protease Do
MALTSTKLLKVAGIGVLLLGIAALAVATAPALRGQVVRDRPFAELTASLTGGSSIGVTVRDVDRADVEREKLPSMAGAVIDEVERDSPAASAGFRAGDVVVAFDGEKVRSARQFARLVEETPEGRDVTTTVVRGGTQHQLKVTPESAARRGILRARDLTRDLRGFAFDLPDTLRVVPRPGRDLLAVPRAERRGRLGVTLQDLTDQLGEYFGVQAGVLVARVEEGTPAKAAGLRAGDVITKIDGQEVRSSDALQRRLATLSGDVTITIVRERREQTVKADLSRREEADGPRTIIK